MLDGQQRTISLCEYVDGSFSVDDKYFYNLPSDQKKKILDYPLFVYVCDGTDSEKLDWFRIINIAGEQLTDQELRNAVYAGSWTSDAKRYFSKTGCAAGTLADRSISKRRSIGRPVLRERQSKPIWQSTRMIPAPCSSGITSVQ